MLVTFLVNFAGALIFLFTFWKKMREDYASEIIFRSAFFIFIGIFGAWLLIFKFFPSGFLFANLIGALVGLTFSVIKFRVRPYETYEAFVAGALPWMALVLLSDSVNNFSLSSFLGFLGILVFIFIFYFLDIRYKNFTWFKSGKIGFVGLAVTGLFFVTRSVIAISGVTMLSFVGKYEGIFSGALAFLSFLVLYNLGRKLK